MTNVEKDPAAKLPSHPSGLVSKHDGSVVFLRNRALGYVSNQIPAVARYVRRRKDTLITTCIGRTFQVYTASHFRLLYVGCTHPDDITALANDRLNVYTASDKTIYVWRVGKVLKHTLRGHTRNVHLLLPFGKHLIAVDESNTIKIWDVALEQEYLEINFKPEEFLVTALAHPPTYLNKIVLGSQQGQMKIWNIKENRLIYTFKGYSPSKITCIEPSPALDVVGVGHQDGTIVVLNLKFDEVIVSFKQDWGAVTQISFRTDGPPIMATASTNGFLAFWNLEEQKIASQLQAHEDVVTTGLCFLNEPLMLTTSPDNSMKLWIFDMSDGGARLLRIREGHTAPPLCIRYHGNSGVSILSSGEDSSLRVFSTISESLHKSMGKASYNRKASKKKNRFQLDSLRMPPIIEFTNETTREKEWDNICAIHSGILQATTWSFDRNKMGEHRLVPEKFTNRNRADFKTETTCLSLTHCGNFVIIGYSSGDTVRFNIQSGLERATYGHHKSPVRGVSSDALNQFVVAGYDDGYLKFWPFKENVTTLMTNIKLPDGVALLRHHRENAMLAVALVNFAVYLIDTDTKATVRRFAGHSAKVNDLTFSPDGRWLITAAMDSTIKVWDIPSSYMIDHFKVERPCISLSMSPTGDYLATSHVNCLGIYLWTNKMLFNQISLRSINPLSDAPYIGLPSNSKDEFTLEEEFTNMEIEDGEENEEDGEEVNFIYSTPEQISKELVTMSTLATSRWQNLLDLELIKKRNRPKAPPKVPKQAPFFLPTVAGLEMKFDLSAESRDEENSRFAQVNPVSNLTIFGKLLEKTVTTGDFESCVQHLKTLGPSMIDFEIRSLHPDAGGNFTITRQFLKTIEYMLETKMNFELAQSYLSVLLRVYGLSLIENPEIVACLRSIAEVQQETWERIESKLSYGIGVVTALRNLV